MCLIVHFPPGKSFPLDALEAAYFTNEDGVGAMWVENNRVHTKKIPVCTFDDVKALYEAKGDKQYVMHLRFKTHGSIDLDNTHPIQILSKETNGMDLWMVHNGVLSFVTAKDKGRSDTWYFVNDYLKPILTKNPNLIFDPVFQQMLGLAVGAGNKLLFLNNAGRTVIINKSSGHDHPSGCWLSNSYSINGSKLYRSRSQSHSTALPAHNYYGYGYDGWEDYADNSDNSKTDKSIPVIGLTAKEVAALSMVWRYRTMPAGTADGLQTTFLITGQYLVKSSVGSRPCFIVTHKGQQALAAKVAQGTILQPNTGSPCCFIEGSVITLVPQSETQKLPLDRPLIEPPHDPVRNVPSKELSPLEQRSVDKDIPPIDYNEFLLLCYVDAEPSFHNCPITHFQTRVVKSCLDKGLLNFVIKSSSSLKWSLVPRLTTLGCGVIVPDNADLSKPRHWNCKYPKSFNMTVVGGEWTDRGPSSVEVYLMPHNKEVHTSHGVKLNWEDFLSDKTWESLKGLVPAAQGVMTPWTYKDDIVIPPMKNKAEVVSPLPDKEQAKLVALYKAVEELEKQFEITIVCDDPQHVLDTFREDTDKSLELFSSENVTSIVFDDLISQVIKNPFRAAAGLVYMAEAIDSLEFDEDEEPDLLNEED